MAIELLKPGRCVVACEPAQPARHRYCLQVRLAAGPTLVVILKNPSLADGVHSDPTAGKVEAWAGRNSFGLIIYVNLFALRSPYPAMLNEVSYADAVGRENDRALTHALACADRLVVAWGNPNGIAPARYRQRIGEVLTLIAEQGQQPIYTVGGLTKQGYPRHGLHWNGAATLEKWRDY